MANTLPQQRGTVVTSLNQQTGTEQTHYTDGSQTSNSYAV